MMPLVKCCTSNAHLAEHCTYNTLYHGNISYTYELRLDVPQVFATGIYILLLETDWLKKLWCQVNVLIVLYIVLQC